jgi:hypothetical protein
MLRRPITIAMILVACGGGSAPAHEQQSVPDPAAAPPTSKESGPRPTTIEEPDAGPLPLEGPNVPYNRAIAKSIHNSYERFEPLLDQLIYHRVRSLELDIHVRREGAAAPSGEWFVYHEDLPTQRTTSCDQLSDCLGLLAAFHDAIPKHEVVTLFVDLKEGFDGGHQPTDLDGAFAARLGRPNIVTPQDLIKACPGAVTIRDAVTGPKCSFPTLAQLRGKFILVTTGGTACDGNSLVSKYGGTDPRERSAFLGPNVDGSCTAAAYDQKPSVVFLNMPLAEKARAQEVISRGLVARIYGGGSEGGLDNASDFQSARTTGANHLATDKVNHEQDGFASTHLTRGFPFTCEGCAADLIEPGNVIGVRTQSGDQFGTADSAYFAYENDPSSATPSTDDVTWSTLVSVPSSHVEGFAKACLIARASADDPGAATVSVCRAFDNHPPRAQVRLTNGAATTSTDASSALFDGISTETPAFLQLAIKGGSDVTTSVSRDGKTWVPITKTTMSVALPIRGIGVSAHGNNNQSVKALFVNLARAKGSTSPTSPTLITTSLLTQKAVGQNASGTAFDGVFPP